MITEKDFKDIKRFFDLAYEKLFETVPVTILGTEYRRMNEIEVILYELINKDKSPE